VILRFAKERAILYTQFRVFQTECFADCSLSLFTHPAEHVFHSESGDALEQVAQGGCGCLIHGGIQGQAGCGSGQPGLVVGDPAHSRGVETT